MNIFRQFLNQIPKIYLPMFDLVISVSNSTVLDFNFADSVA